MRRDDHQPLTVAAFVGDVWEHACPTIRLTAPLHAAGVRLLHGSDHRDQTIQIDLDAIDQADLVVLQRDFPRHTALYQQVMQRSRALGKPVVYDLDPFLLTDLPPTHPGWQRYAVETRFPLLHAVLEADCVTVATDLLAEHLRPFQPNTRVLSNFLPDDLWPLELPTEEDDPARPLTVGYLGSPAHADDLVSVLPALTSLLDRHGDRLELMLWGMDVPTPLLGRANVRADFLGLVDYARFADYFVRQRVDIFIAPLRDNAFNRCKSPIKFLEYGACAKPGVFAGLPPYASVVTHGVDGLLASYPDDWERCLESLIADATFRRGMGAAAGATVNEKWRLSGHAALWSELYCSVLAAPRAPSPDLALRTVATCGLWHGELAGRITAADGEIARLQASLTDQKAQTAILGADLTRSREETRAVIARLEQAELRAESLSAQLDRLIHSRGWRVVTALYRARQAAVPSGSGREAAGRNLVKGLRAWRQHGLRHALRRTGQKLRATATGEAPAQSLPAYASVEISPGRPCPEPAISVVALPAAAPAAAAWLAGQTCLSTELVLCDGVTTHSDGRDAWPAAGGLQLAAGLAGRYVCFSSPHLLDQPPTYLESNLVALESEHLAFTVNARGQADWLLAQLASGCLPASPGHPLHRLVARVDCLADDLSLDLGALAAADGSAAGVPGRVILHESSTADPDDGVPAAPPTGVRLRLAAGHLLAAPTGEVPVQTVHPVNKVLPAGLVLDDRATVLLLLQFFAVGGAERVALDVIRALRDRVRFVAVSMDPHSSALGTTVDSFRELTPYVYSMADFLPFELNESFLDYLIGRFQPRTLYVANGTDWIYDALPRLHRRYPRLRLANQVYDHEAGWINRYDASLAPMFDANIAVNQRICQAFLDRGAGPGAVHRIENGIDGNEFDPASVDPDTVAGLRSQLQIPPGPRVVCMICRLHPQKRPMDFVELARRHAANQSLFFLIVGDGPLGNRIQQEMDRLRLPNLRRLPFYRPSRDIYALADVIVLPSEYEGMPMVVLEAQVMGKPVLVTDVGNNREIVEQGSGVVVSSIGDVSALDGGLRQALALQTQPGELRRRMLDRFGLDVMAERYRRALLGDDDA